MKVGDRTQEKLTIYGHDSLKSDHVHTGTIIYVHPENIFYTAEFEVSGGTIRECFYCRNKRRRR